jgi:molybdenum cofactor biosynthesis protein B
MTFNGKVLNTQAMKAEHVQQINIICGVLTVSTSRTVETDKSGKSIISLFSEAGIETQYYAVVPDRIDAIRKELAKALDVANCIVINGGTGLTHDDCTIEAVHPFFEKNIEGFGELFRILSYQEIGSSAMLSRAVAGISGYKAIFCIPGSPDAVKLAVQSLILPEIRHILSHANK